MGVRTCFSEPIQMTRETVVNGRAGQLRIEGSRFRYERDGQVIEGEFSLVPAHAGGFSLLIGRQSYRVVLARGEAVVNGTAFTVEVFDPRDRRAAARGGSQRGSLQVTASMPGKIVRVLAAPGDQVEEGQGLVVVEAMKMQNEMKSPKAGRVVEVRTQAGATVSAGDVLVVIE
jgi:biotin carboxyl carrier protein